MRERASTMKLVLRPAQLRAMACIFFRPDTVEGINQLLGHHDATNRHFPLPGRDTGDHPSEGAFI